MYVLPVEAGTGGSGSPIFHTYHETRLIESFMINVRDDTS